MEMYVVRTQLAPGQDRLNLKNLLFGGRKRERGRMFDVSSLVE